jgi:hypothetical protein
MRSNYVVSEETESNETEEIKPVKPKLVLADETVLSILIPSIPERLALLTPLVEKLSRQIADKPVELLVMMDNRKHPLGSKRNLMMSNCKGDFLAHLDDDDDISDDYVDSILSALQAHPDTDVLTFNSQSDLGDGFLFTVRTGLKFENEQTNITKRKQDDGTEIDVREDIKRKPWHWCVWRASVARAGIFPVKFLGEDWHWIQQVTPLCQRETHIDKVLHYYFYRKTVSLS